MSAGRALATLLSLVLVGTLFYWRAGANRAVDAQVERTHAKALSTLMGCKDYGKNRAFLAPLQDDAHRRAFDAAYTPGRRRAPASFDERKYATEFFGTFVSASQRVGNTELNLAMRQLQVSVENAIDSGKDW